MLENKKEESQETEKNKDSKNNEQKELKYIWHQQIILKEVINATSLLLSFISCVHFEYKSNSDIFRLLIYSLLFIFTAIDTLIDCKNFNSKNASALLTKGFSYVTIGVASFLLIISSGLLSDILIVSLNGEIMFTDNKLFDYLNMFFREIGYLSTYGYLFIQLTAFIIQSLSNYFNLKLKEHKFTTEE